VQKIKNNPIIREEVEIFYDEKYNHSTRAVHPLIIGSTRQPKNPNIQKSK
jgi:hypothetical protein